MPELKRTSALDGREPVCLAQHQATLSVLPDRSLLRLKVHMSAASRARAALPELLGASPLSSTRGQTCALWTGPDSWLLMSRELSAARVQESIELALAGMVHACTDQSDALVVLGLEGPGVRDVLSSGCGLDFAAPTFAPGHCCSTRFARFQLLIHRPEEKEYFELFIDRSYAAALWNWLHR